MNINEDEIKQEYKSYLNFINNENQRIRNNNFRLLMKGKPAIMKPYKIVSYKKYKKDYIKSIKQIRGIE